MDSDSDSDDDLPLSLAFLTAPKVDKGKRRATDLSEGVTGELSVSGMNLSSKRNVGRTLKRSRTTNDDLSSPPQPARAALTASRSLSVLSETINPRAPPAGGMTAAEKKALKAIETERAKAEKAREKQRVIEERAKRKRDQEVNKVRIQAGLREG